MKEALLVLTSNLRAELKRQQELLHALNEQKEAIVSRDYNNIQRSVDKLTQLGIEGAHLENGRRAAIQHVADRWGVEPKKVMMSDIVRREGSAFPELINLYHELKQVVKQVADFSRKLGALIRQYRDVYSIASSMILESVGVQHPSSALASGGVIVNAEG